MRSGQCAPDGWHTHSESVKEAHTNSNEMHDPSSFMEKPGGGSDWHNQLYFQDVCVAQIVCRIQFDE